MGLLESREEGEEYRGDAECSDEPQVELAEDGVAHEGVVDYRVEGGGDQGGNAGVVEPKEDVA